VDRSRIWGKTSPAHEIPITFYLAGDFKLLRAAWIFLTGKAELARTKCRDLFWGERDVLQVGLAKNNGLIDELQPRLSSLDYYSADIPILLRFIAHTGEFSPDTDPAFRVPTRLKVKTGRGEYFINMEPECPFLISLQADLCHYDPDLILTDHGDGWLMPKLANIGINRDRERGTQTRKANSYFAYGQTIHRGAQSHLFGRWHIDRRNAMMFNEYGLEGVLEQSRVTGISVQEMARKSPGAGITAMQMLTAMRTGVMVPLHKQQAEGGKTLAGLIRADKGGLIYQPTLGVHRDVAQIDFASMYPSIMVHHNVSPETLGKEDPKQGLTPQTLAPLLEKRLKLKELLTDLDERDCQVKVIKQRAAALKWLLVVCFGYLGYKNARFGKIESHEAVTAISLWI